MLRARRHMVGTQWMLPMTSPSPPKASQESSFLDGCNWKDCSFSCADVCPPEPSTAWLEENTGRAQTLFPMVVPPRCKVDSITYTCFLQPEMSSRCSHCFHLWVSSPAWWGCSSVGPRLCKCLLPLGTRKREQMAQESQGKPLLGLTYLPRAPSVEKRLAMNI